MSIIKNISKISIKIDNVTIPPYQTHKFDIIKDRLCLNKYENRHMIEYVKEPVVNTIPAVETKVEKPVVSKKPAVVEEPKVEVEVTETEDLTTKKAKSVNKRKLVKTDDENIETKGEMTDATD